MGWAKWSGLAAGILLIISCFSTWVIIASKNIIVSGLDATGTNLGKPGYLHLLLTLFFILFNFVPKIWAKRTNLLVTAVNLAWAIRNYFIISACHGGDCPEKQAGLYLVVLASLLMMTTAMFPDLELPGQKNGKR